MILSSLAWRSGSPLFDAIDATGPVPSYEDVALPTAYGSGVKSSALLNPRVMSLSGAKTSCKFIIIMPRCACASEVYGSVSVCLSV